MKREPQGATEMGGLGRTAGAAVPHLLHVFSTFAVGGSQTRFVSLANALGPKYRHTILAMDGNLAAAAGLDRQVDHGFAAIPVVKSRFISLANLRHARRTFHAVRPDLLVTYNWGSIEWSLANWPLRFCRQIHIEDGFGSDESPLYQKPQRALTRRLLLSHCHRVIVPSRTLLDVATRVWRLSPSLVLYLPNGIDCRRFAAPPDAALLAELGIADGVPVIGTVAGLRPEKNLLRLLRVAASLPAELGARIVIVGDGPERGPLAAAAARLGIADRVVLTGAIERPERIIGRFDLFALTSDTEQMPNSVLEAMAAGVPVVATDVGDVRSMVGAAGADLVIPARDEEALGQVVLALLRDPARRARIGQANQQRANAEFRLATMVERYDALFSGRPVTAAPKANGP